jgi:hypothetical protein
MHSFEVGHWQQAARVQLDAMRCDAMRCDAMRCDAMRCDRYDRVHSCQHAGGVGAPPYLESTVIPPPRCQDGLPEWVRLLSSQRTAEHTLRLCKEDSGNRAGSLKAQRGPGRRVVGPRQVRVGRVGSGASSYNARASSREGFQRRAYRSLSRLSRSIPQARNILAATVRQLAGRAGSRQNVPPRPSSAHTSTGIPAPRTLRLRYCVSLSGHLEVSCINRISVCGLVRSSPQRRCFLHSPHPRRHNPTSTT